jgi:hypothetical protein
VLDIAAIIVDFDSNFTFSSLLKDGALFYRKLDVKDGQEKRTVDLSTLDWWKGQSSEAKAVLKKSPHDVHISKAMLDFKDFLEQNNFSLKYDLAYCRGQSYDFPIIADIVHGLFDTWGLGYSMFPCAFWNQRDIRTAIAHTMLSLDLRKLPVAKGTFEGFVKHNSIHDCCKDAVLLKTAVNYAKGVLEIPEEYDLI